MASPPSMLAKASGDRQAWVSELERASVAEWGSELK
jgi:hypothetical protein